MDEATRRNHLQGLYARIQADPLARNERMGRIFVPGVGSLAGGGPVLVGEAPGREEELLGEPFVGRAGRNLSELLGEIGWSRHDVFITNLLKYRPIDGKRANRCPTGSEGRYALTGLLEELEILNPSLVISLGLSAARTLLDRRDLRMADANGSTFSNHGHRILVTYHPSPFNYLVPSKRKALREVFLSLQELTTL